MVCILKYDKIHAETVERNNEIMKEFKPIKSEKEYQAALKKLGKFFDSNSDQASQSEQDYFEALAELVVLDLIGV